MIRTYPTNEGYTKIALHFHKIGVAAADVAATLKAVNYQVRLGGVTYNVKYDIVENMLHLLEWQKAKAETEAETKAKTKAKTKANSAKDAQ